MAASIADNLAAARLGADLGEVSRSGLSRQSPASHPKN